MTAKTEHLNVCWTL